VQLQLFHHTTLAVSPVALEIRKVRNSFNHAKSFSRCLWKPGRSTLSTIKKQGKGEKLIVINLKTLETGKWKL
jgi:hypothetical protein